MGNHHQLLICLSLVGTGVMIPIKTKVIIVVSRRLRHNISLLVTRICVQERLHFKLSSWSP